MITLNECYWLEKGGSGQHKRSVSWDGLLVKDLHTSKFRSPYRVDVFGQSQSSPVTAPKTRDVHSYEYM